MKIIHSKASPELLEESNSWNVWESGEDERFEYDYDQDVQFVVQAGKAVIHSSGNSPVSIEPGDHVVIRKGVHGTWDISSPITNRYQYIAE